jgi:dipeptidyl-peptidase-4
MFLRKYLYFFIFISLIFTLNTKATKKISLEDIYIDYKFFPNGIQSPTLLNDGERFSLLENENTISIFNLITGNKIYELLNASKLGKHSDIIIDDYSVSSDETKVLLLTKTKIIYRHSTVSVFLIYDTITKQIDTLFDGYQEYASFSPDGKKIAFIYDNNLYFKDLITNKIKQITFDGKKNEIINGKSDWVYEEEFGVTQMYYWSPDGENIAFVKFDERQVNMYKMLFYESDYPEWFEYKYPIPGEKNSIISVFIYNLKQNKLIPIDIGNDSDQYIPQIKWTNINNKLAIVRLNRKQNKLDILLSDANTGQSSILYSETSDTYISKPTEDLIIFLKNSDKVLIMSEKDGFRHFYLYNNQGKFINQITRGPWEDVSFRGYDDKNKIIYFDSKEESELQLHLYSISLNGKNKNKITNLKGYNRTYISKKNNYFINIYSDANTPYTYYLCDIKGNIIRVLQDNQTLKDNISEYNFAKKEFFKIPTENNILLNAYIIKPQDFDSSKRYPVFIYNYGGPEIQLVVDDWDEYMPWFQYLVQNNILVVCVDNRGTEGRGVAFKKCTYGQLGKLETTDLINTAKYLGSMPFVDPGRIGIFGWSFGGYTTLLCMTLGSEYFKLGIAVAPVTSWKFYDSVYSERYLGLPKDNPKGYEDYSPINMAELLKGKLLLVHGEVDDNVHYQNTAKFIDELIKHKKQFEMQIYPNRNHFISGYNTSYHLFKRLSDFIFNNL